MRGKTNLQRFRAEYASFAQRYEKQKPKATKTASTL
jgi:hypothetical protein